LAKWFPIAAIGAVFHPLQARFQATATPRRKCRRTTDNLNQFVGDKLHFALKKQL
jgi:uncharacterized membrane-anchored protein YjiN (DUF445 family)